MGKILIMLMVVVAGGLFIFLSQEQPVAQAPETPSASAPAVEVPAAPLPLAAPPSASQAPVETYTIRVGANNWYFEPEEIRVKVGTKVKITLQGVSGAHQLYFPAFSAKSAVVGEGETDTFEFVADKRGEFPFQCSVFCGEGHKGMTGKLVVE